jgi:hypothetical protein
MGGRGSLLGMREYAEQQQRQRVWGFLLCTQCIFVLYFSDVVRMLWCGGKGVRGYGRWDGQE